MRKVEVCPYNEVWTERFHQEAVKLKGIYGSQIVSIHHIGSTAIKGLNAKPIIDIMPVVKDISSVDQFDEQMKAFGYEPKGEYGIPGRRYFQKGGDARTHHVHIYQLGDVNIERHLAFRDYLRFNDELKHKYGNLKEELARTFPNDIASYRKGKEQLVTDIEKKALNWYRVNS